MPFINTMATSQEGIAWYIDDAATPNLSPEALALWQERRKSDANTRRLDGQGIVLLDGSDPRFEWRNDPAAPIPGLVPYSHQPRLERTDYIFNANNSFWLANAKALLSGDFSPMYGEQATARSLRTRNNALTLGLVSPDKPAGADNRFTLDELGNAILSNRSLGAELLKDELVERCSAISSNDLAEACRILAKWNGRYDLDSRGAVLFREWLAQFTNADALAKGKLFAIDFDPADPVGTPRALAAGPQAIENLARAVELLRSRQIPLDVPLGELQYTDKNGRRIPIHAGGNVEGLMNIVGYSLNSTTLEPADAPKLVKGSRLLTEKGYPVTTGSSFLMVMEFTAGGPRAKAFLTYSESGDPASPYFADQTELFSKKQWRPILFEERQIASDIKREYTVTNR
jgi:acyl-homoserine-lactone acylase